MIDTIQREISPFSIFVDTKPQPVNSVVWLLHRKAPSPKGCEIGKYQPEITHKIHLLVSMIYGEFGATLLPAGNVAMENHPFTSKVCGFLGCYLQYL